MFRLLTLGGLALTRDGVTLMGVTSQSLAVLVRVAAAGDRGISRQKLAGCFWSERDERHARHSLSQALYELRLAVGGEHLVLGRDVLRFDTAQLSCDMLDLEAALRTHDVGLASALHEGPFLDGIYLTGADEFERWSESVRARLSQELLRSVRAEASAARESGDVRGALAWLLRASELDSLELGTALDLVRTLAAAGDRAVALRRAQQYIARVRTELSIEPDARMLDLVRQLEMDRQRAAAREERGGRHEQPVSVVGPTPTPAELCARGRQCVHTFTEDSYDEGIACLQRAVELDPTHAESLVTLGSLYIVLSQVDPKDHRRARGAEFCRRAAELQPDLAEAWLWQGWALMLDERFDEAAACARRGVLADPDGPFSPYVTAWVALSDGLKHGRWRRCIDAAISYRRVLLLHPGEQHALMPLTSLYALAGQYESAESYCDKALQVEGSTSAEMRLVGAQTLAGLLDLRRGRLEKARDCFQRALRDYAPAQQFFAPYARALTLCGLGDIERHEGRYDAAVSRYLEARTMLEPLPYLMGCGYVVVRLELRLAGTFRRLRMRSEELRHVGAGETLATTRAGHSFNCCWEVSEAQLHYDRAVYHATCADRERMLGALDAAAAYGWSEPALLTHEPAFEFCRDDPALLDILDRIAARGRLPEDAPTRAPSDGLVRMTFGDARSRVEAAGTQ